MKTLLNFICAGASLAAIAAPGLAYAQAATNPAAASGEDAQDDEIVVTGTLIRGTAAVGSQTITVDAQAIIDKGATSTNELLGSIPQMANMFNGRIEGDPRGVSAGISITRPNLRNIPSVNTTSGALTLVLVDGMRIAPVGVNQSSPDVDIIPAAVLQGVDVVTDGGSSLYGADAVAGVLNFRTMRKFDGIKLDGNYGFGSTIKGFHEWDAAITAGTSWTGGNAYVSVGQSRRDGILNGQTSWANGVVYSAAGVPSVSYTQCDTPQITLSRYVWFNPPGVWTNNPQGPGAGPRSTGTGCDRTVAESYVPQQKRSNVYAALSQAFGDNVDLRVTGYWTKRDTAYANFNQGYTASTGVVPVAPTTPGTTPGQTFDFPQPIGVGFSFGPNAAYVNRPSRVGFTTWGITPELTIKLGSNWQVRTSAHYGRSTNFQSFAGVDAVKAQCYITGCTGIAAGQLDPLNVAAASAAVVTDITNYASSQDMKQQLLTLRSIADGSLFALPSGDVKLAVGVEYQRNKADTRLNAGPFGSLDSLPFTSRSRNSKSVFAELSVPLTSFADLSGSVRYDDYSDFGSTTNPNIGLTLKPASWLKVFGHWNTSFNAPTAVDDLAIATGRFVCGIYLPGGNGTSRQPRPTDPLGRDTSKQGSCAMVLQGSTPGLQPQTAKSWAVGFEATPAAGLRVGGEVYSIDLKNALGTLNPSSASTYTTQASQYTYNVTAAGYAAVLAQLTNGASLGTQQPSSNIAIIVDTRTTNLNAAKIKGVDLHASYDADTTIGHFALGISATRQTKAIITNGGATTDELFHGSPALFATSYLGWNSGGLSAKVTVNHSGSFRDGAVNNVNYSEEVRPFTTTNLNLGYSFKDSGGMLNGTSFHVIVDNLFETTPQTIKRNNINNTSYNNWTLGRVIKLGVSAKF